MLKGFLGGYGRAFCRINDKRGEKTILKRGNEVEMETLTGDEVEVVPFRRGKNTWSVEWQTDQDQNAMQNGHSQLPVISSCDVA